MQLNVYLFVTRIFFRFFAGRQNNLSAHIKRNDMQTLLNISLQDDNTLLVTSDLFRLETKDENTLVNWARKHIRADDYKSRHPLLRDYLIQWRRDKARETGLSAFLILTNRTLCTGIKTKCNERPTFVLHPEAAFTPCLKSVLT